MKYRVSTHAVCRMWTGAARQDPAGQAWEEADGVRTSDLLFP